MSMEVLNRRRTAIKGSLKKLRTYANNAASTGAKIEDIRIRIKHTDTLFQEFMNIEEKIFALNPQDQSQYEAIEEVYYEIMAGLSERDRTMSLTTGIEPSTNESFQGPRTSIPDLKLPGLRVPKFTGEYTEWQTFYQLFTTTIHNNTNLHPVQKFQFLMNSLGDEPARLIKHMDITEANYLLVLNKLKDRYDRKRHTVNKFIQMFLDQPKIQRANAQDLRKMFDVSDEVIRALQGLGNSATQRDVWLLYILESKVDDVTCAAWMQETASEDFPSLEAFLKFITNRADALEYQCAPTVEKPKISNVPAKSHHIKSMTITSITCPVCNTNDHQMYQCKEFRKMTIPKRRNVIKESNRCFNCLGANHSVRNCRSERRCQLCRRRHHSLLHEAESNLMTTLHQSDAAGPTNSDVDRPESKQQTLTKSNGTTIGGTSEASSTIIMSTNCPEHSIISSVLPTALVQVQDCIGQWHYCRALLDSGAESSFISEECAQRLGLKREEAKLSISGLGNQGVGHTRGSVQLVVKPHFPSEFQMSVQAYVAQKITNTKSPLSLNQGLLRKLTNEIRAHPSPIQNTRLDLLIGVDHFWSLLLNEQLRNGERVLAQNSKLGWIITGTAHATGVTSVMSIAVEEGIEKALTKFWEVEEVSQDQTMGGETETHPCELHYLKTVTRDCNGCYVVRLPFVEVPEPLGNSYEIAKTRLLAMERKFKRDSRFHQLYTAFMNEYIELQHMSIVKNPGSEVNVYLPHHGVKKESSTTTKLRVVFDASATTSTGTSLNKQLLVGPTIQNTLYHILIHFRKHRFAFSADIEKMYRQIWIHPSDRKYQRILWREKMNDPIDVYELNTVTYGMAASPFLATQTLRMMATANESRYPEASKAIKENMYMDDLLTGADSLNDATRIGTDLVNIMADAHMNLRKWSSNSLELVAKLNCNNESEAAISFNHADEVTQILGLLWLPETDQFTYKIQLKSSPTVTKRTILAEFSRLFDPLGLLAPFVIRIKILFQELWTLKLTWDESLPHSAQQKWDQIRDEITSLKTITVHRWLGPHNEKSILHGFSDASEKAYTASVYLVTEEEGVRRSRLITAKTKVAPVNSVSLPRLELCGALLVTKLLKQVGLILGIQTSQMHAWTDSCIVLDWLSDIPQRWKTYVANRTSKILQILPRTNWHHVASANNAADCATRGMTPKELQQHNLWWNGPEYLLLDSSHWPEITKQLKVDPLEVRKQTVTMLCRQGNEEEFIYQLQERYSNFSQFTLVFAYVCRAINIWTRKLRITGRLTRDEMLDATNRILKIVQEKHFDMEIRSLKNHQPVPKSSKLITLDPMIDKHGMLRVAGRIENAPLDLDQRHPIILPNHDPVVKKTVKSVKCT